MIAVDTNVVVRFLVNDDQAQAAVARRLFEANAIWIATSVLLETEWVLRASYDLSPSTIAQRIHSLLGIASVRTDQPAKVAQALGDYEAGLDFADALHLAFSADAESFATFDRDFVRRAKARGRSHVRTP